MAAYRYVDGREELGALLLDRLFAELLDGSQRFDPDRLHQEAILLATKADIREELDRLVAHVAQGKKLISGGGPIGRKLDFLAQELNRESNTLCSKANDLELTNIGLELKAVVESAGALLLPDQREVDSDLLRLAAGEGAADPGARHDPARRHQRQRRDARDLGQERPQRQRRTALGPGCRAQAAGGAGRVGVPPGLQDRVRRVDLRRRRTICAGTGRSRERRRRSRPGNPRSRRRRSGRGLCPPCGPGRNSR